MRKKSDPGSSAGELKALRKEVELLKKQLAKVLRTQEASHKPGNIRATKVVVDSLEVVDPSGKVVASIDNKGHLFCRTVLASTATGTRGVFIDGGNQRRITAGKLELLGKTGNKPAIEATAAFTAGKIIIRDPGTKQSLHLKGSGAPIIAFEKTRGVSAASLSVNEAAGGSLKLKGTREGTKAGVHLSISPGNGAGGIHLLDQQGKIVGKLP